MRTDKTTSPVLSSLRSQSEVLWTVRITVCVPRTPEYQSLQNYLFWRYLVERDISQTFCQCLDFEEKLFCRKASDGGDYQLAQYIEDGPGAAIVERILQRVEGEQDENQS